MYYDRVGLKLFITVTMCTLVLLNVMVICDHILNDGEGIKLHSIPRGMLLGD